MRVSLEGKAGWQDLDTAFYWRSSSYVKTKCWIDEASKRYVRHVA